VLRTCVALRDISAKRYIDDGEGYCVDITVLVAPMYGPGMGPLASASLAKALGRLAAVDRVLTPYLP